MRAKLFLFIWLTVIAACDDDKAPGLQVTFIDVGQGDATLIELPSGEAILVDGGDDGAGEEAILPLLTERGIDALTLVVATHPHADHVGGLDEVLERVPVEEIWVNGEASTSRAYASFLAAAIGSGALIFEVPAGHVRDIGRTRLEVLWSDAGYPGANNDSIVIAVELGDTRVLLTGDIEREAAAELVALYGDDLESDLVKIPHHGSANTTNRFIARTAPKLAIVCAGADNPYGHPAPATIAAYRAADAHVCGTMTSGDITVGTTATDLDFDCEEISAERRF
jgi:competence protein ComEC